MKSDIVVVCGHELPPLLASLVKQGRWRPPSSEVLATVFGEQPSAPDFYGFDGMANETSHLLEMDREYQIWYLGRRDDSVYPGDLDLSECVLIGDLGPERPIALDYRKDRRSPEVVLLTSQGWLCVCPNVETLVEKAGM